MGIVRAGKILDGKDMGSINKAKKASRLMQSEGRIVTVVPNKTKRYYPVMQAIIPPMNNCKHQHVYDAIALKEQGKSHTTYRLW